MGQLVASPHSTPAKGHRNYREPTPPAPRLRGDSSTCTPVRGAAARQPHTLQGWVCKARAVTPPGAMRPPHPSPHGSGKERPCWYPGLQWTAPLSSKVKTCLPQVSLLPWGKKPRPLLPPPGNKSRPISHGDLSGKATPNPKGQVRSSIPKCLHCSSLHQVFIPNS